MHGLQQTLLHCGDPGGHSVLLYLNMELLLHAGLQSLIPEACDWLNMLPPVWPQLWQLVEWSEMHTLLIYTHLQVVSGYTLSSH